MAHLTAYSFKTAAQLQLFQRHLDSVIASSTSAEDASSRRKLVGNCAAQRCAAQRQEPMGRLGQTFPS